MTEPLAHHYNFAHRILPGWFFNDARKFVETCDEDGMLFIHWLWEQAAEGIEEVVEPTDLGFEKETRNGTTALIITCPEPVGMTEAYYVVLVLTKNSERVFTLEHSFDLEENPLAISCEWTKDQTHVNKGAIGSTDCEKFVDYVFNSLISN